jgi:AcrR family transcriptional regulator
MFSKGYEQMAVQDILDEVKISRGAFHHYFASRGALLEAFIEQIRQETEKPLLPLIHDPKLTALEKFQGFFDTLDRLRTARRADVIRIGRVWYSDSNAVVRLRVAEAMIEQRAPLLNAIVHQGIQEGVFAVADPDKAGYVIMTLLQGMGDTHAGLLLQLDQTRDNDQHLIDEVVAVHAAYMDAIERVLGAPSHAFYRADFEVVKNWVEALRATS